MAKYSRFEVATAMKETGVVPVFFDANLEVSKNVVKACYEGGIRVFEFVNRGDFAHEVFGELTKWANKELPGMIMGAGSIVEPITAGLYIQLGANFIVSPCLNEEVAKVCNRRGVSYSPGCGTISEISKAQELGVDIVKVFPASEIGGPSFVKSGESANALTNIMPTGGVDTTEGNLKGWFDAGVTCVGMGSNLFPKEIMQAGDWKALAAKSQELIDTIKKVRKK